MTNTPEPSRILGAASSSMSSPSSWWWRLEDSSGTEVRVPGLDRVEFPSQSDAESWVGEEWEMLLEGGVDAVTLFEGGREVYGPMSLHPA